MQTIMEGSGFVNRIATGIIIGGILGAIGAEYASINSSAKRKVIRQGKKVMSKAEDVLEDLSKDMW